MLISARASKRILNRLSQCCHSREQASEKSTNTVPVQKKDSSGDRAAVHDARTGRRRRAAASLFSVAMNTSAFSVAGKKERLCFLGSEIRRVVDMLVDRDKRFQTSRG